MRRTLTAAAAGLVLALMPGNAWADDVFDPVNCDETPTAAQCVIDVVDVGTPGDPSGSGGEVALCHDFVGEVAPCYIQKWGWNGGDGCYYRLASPQWADVLGQVTPPAAWYEGSCADVGNGQVLLTRMRVFTAPPGQALLVVEAIRRLRLPVPVIRVNPAPPAAQLVFVPTWLWLEASSWGSRSATASVPGLSVTATATPTMVTWFMGDGATLTCQGPGTPWRVGADPTASSPDCGHTYTRSSGEGTFTVRATIAWRVSWVGGGASGTEPALTSTASVALTVAESQTVTTRTGG